MEEKNFTMAIPKQKNGESITAGSQKILSGVQEAADFYKIAKSRLLHVGNWNRLAGEALAKFQLTDPQGNVTEGPAEEGFFIRIDIPGPGSKEAEGYDWVRIEAIENVDSGDIQSVAMRVRPAAAPGSGEDAPTHFYDQNSTSTFTVSQENTCLTVAIYDRNIEANKEPDSIIDKVRNVITGFIGKKVFSKIQWESLAEGILSDP